MVRLLLSAGTEELKKLTNTNSLEEAFLKLTGKVIREEAATGLDHMRMRRRMRTKNKY
jgi:hypothetical protein